MLKVLFKDFKFELFLNRYTLSNLKRGEKLTNRKSSLYGIRIQKKFKSEEKN